MSQQYSLKWNNHQPNFISVFSTLLQTKTLVDVTLAAEGQHLQAHKIVLSACSTYFQELFVDNPSSHPIVIIKDVSFCELQKVVDFMYYGEINVTEQNLTRVLDTAKLLKIKGLTEMPDSTSVTRQNMSSELPTSDTIESLGSSASPSSSPYNRRKRYRKSSSGPTIVNTNMHLVHEEMKNEDYPQNSHDLNRSEAITLSSVSEERSAREFEDRLDVMEPQGDDHSMNVEEMSMENANCIIPGGQWSMIEHPYPRYPNACIGGALQGEAGMYMNNVMSQHGAGEHEGHEYAHALGLAGGSPGPSCAAEPPPAPDAPDLPQPKRRRTTNPQAAENFQRALEAVRIGGIGFCKAARLFGVNNRTLWLEYKKKGYPNNRPSIKSRIKREHSSPPLQTKEEMPQQEQHMALLCPPHPVPVGFIDPRPLDFQVQVSNPNLNVNYMQ